MRESGFQIIRMKKDKTRRVIIRIVRNIHRITRTRIQESQTNHRSIHHSNRTIMRRMNSNNHIVAIILTRINHNCSSHRKNAVAIISNNSNHRNSSSREEIEERNHRELI